MSDLSNVLLDRQKLVLDMLTIERTYEALAYNNIPYNNFTYIADRENVTAKLEELLEIATINKLTITTMVLRKALNKGN